MDVSRPRERIVSILNDNDCPSFAIRRDQTSTSKPKEQSHHQHSFSYSRLERPQLYRFSEYAKKPSPASEPSTPPLLRHDSSSSSTSSAMENSPSPITPEYPYIDAQNNVISLYDALVQQNQTYLPSPTTITPLIEQGMMLAPVMTDPTMPYAQKLAPQFHLMPAIIPTSTPNTTQPLAPAAPDAQQTQMQSQVQAASAPHQQQPAPKKNKYPCPYAQSHGCHATFTTSGHAARHGKKHTGEKSVHCPTCGKAFTRKDNMKQHERTHKNSSSASNASDDSRKSKAAVTKAAVAERAHKRAASEAQSTSSISRKDSGQHQSPLSEVTSAGDAIQPTLATSISDPVSMESSEPPPMVFSEDGTTGPTVIAPAPQTHSELSAYPPLDEETLGQINQRPMPSFPRTFSDLDTLAMAATYDPYNIQNGQL